MGNISLGLFAPKRFQLWANRDIHAISPDAEFAVLQFFVRLVPLVASIGHIGEQHFQNHFLALDCTLTLRLNFHAFGSTATAAGGQRALAFDLNHAGPAIAIGAHSIFVAKVGDINSVALGGLED